MRRIEFTQFVPARLDVVWDFFSSPGNLSKITPPEMGFIIISPPQPEMYSGMFIMYKVSPLLGIKLNWVTEITHVREKLFFVDEQRRGPYQIWHHEHHFREVEGGVEMRDILHYRVPFGILGTLVDHLFVKKKVRAIFSFREKRIHELFPS
ncbi:MAG TPA: SRPBCC family protein [Bacteroidales bacterium]|nr:SRPBCC family protein [Bacteroidales bacterium]